MSIKVTFEFESFEDGLAFMMKHTEAPSEVVDDTPAAAAKPPKATKKTTKKATTKKAEAKEESQDYTEDDCRAAIAAVNEAKDLATAKEVMKAYKVKKIPDLKPEQYADFIQACKAYLD